MFGWGRGDIEIHSEKQFKDRIMWMFAILSQWKHC